MIARNEKQLAKMNIAYVPRQGATILFQAVINNAEKGAAITTRAQTEIPNLEPNVVATGTG